MKKMNKGFFAIPLLLFGLFLVSYIYLPETSEALATTTYYSKATQGSASGLGLTYWRTKYSTTHQENYIQLGKKQLLGTVTNTSKKKSKTMSATYAKTESRTYTLSASVPIEVLKKAVTVTIGGSISYSTTVSLTGSIDVPKNSSRNFYYRMNTTTSKYKTVVQKQKGIAAQNWKNSGSPYTEYENVVTKTPELIA